MNEPTVAPLVQARQAIGELRYYRNRRSRTPQGTDRRETAAWEALLGALDEIDTRLRALEEAALQPGGRAAGEIEG